MVHHDIPQYNMIYHDITIVYHDIPWYIMVYHDIPWYIFVRGSSTGQVT